MKVAVSIPDATFAKADALAKKMGTSRSAVFAKAIDAYELDERDEDLTEAANRYADEMTQEQRAEQDMWVQAGARTVLRHTEW
jgi:metal-responsive CopG/Arc/MetJ family transcriptional regulator